MKNISTTNPSTHCNFSMAHSDERMNTFRTSELPEILMPFHGANVNTVVSVNPEKFEGRCPDRKATMDTAISFLTTTCKLPSIVNIEEFKVLIVKPMKSGTNIFR